MRAAERAADLTRQLLAYAGKGRFVMRTLDLSDLVREIGGLVQTSLPKQAQLRLQLADDLPGIDADPGQLQQIVMNLVINGAEAIGPEGGSVLVRTGVQEVDTHYISTMSSAGELLKPGRYITLEVHDTGAGMDEATLAKIFDPFFTTKFAGRGLGLSAVLGIVRAHHGALKVYSKPGQGTTFKVLFRASANPVVHQAQPAKRQLDGAGTVLVVDDEEIVRLTAKHTLERYGYHTMLANDGVTALEAYRDQPGLIGLVLLDLTMPVMNGEETLRHLQTVNPRVKVLLSSGYNEVEAVQRFAGKGLAGFIQKPYTAAGLAEKVKEALLDGEMTPDEFRAAGHRLVDWLADYRLRVAEFPVMAKTAPGEIKAQLPAEPPDEPEPFDRVAGRLGKDRPSGALALAAPALLRLFSIERFVGQRARRFRQHGLGRTGSLVAIEPRAHGSGRGGHRLDAPDERSFERVERRDSGYGVHVYAGCASMRAGTRHRLQPRPRRIASRETADGCIHFGAKPQLGRKGRAIGRIRP